MVSLNTNYCYTFNWWTLSSIKDPASILTWLTKTLEDAEAAHEKVKIDGKIQLQKKNKKNKKMKK